MLFGVGQKQLSKRHCKRYWRSESSRAGQSRLQVPLVSELYLEVVLKIEEEAVSGADDDLPPMVYLRDVLRYKQMTPAEKAQAKQWSAFKVLVYWIEDAHGRCVYIGMTRNGIRARFSTHFKSRNFIGKLFQFHPEILNTWKVSIFPMESVERARHFEKMFTRLAKPLFNFRGNSDRWEV